MKKIIFLFAVLPLIMCSCATIMSGHKQMVSFSSTPSGAKVIVDGKEAGFTPLTTKIKREAKSVRFEKDGYDTVEYTLRQTFNGWFVGNLFFGWIPGMLIDLLNGSYVNTEKNVHKELPKK